MRVKLRREEKRQGKVLARAAGGDGWKVEREAGRGEEKTQWSEEEEEEKDTRSKAKVERDTGGEPAVPLHPPPPPPGAEHGGILQ